MISMRNGLFSNSTLNFFKFVKHVPKFFCWFVSSSLVSTFSTFTLNFLIFKLDAIFPRFRVSSPCGVVPTALISFLIIVRRSFRIFFLL